MKVLLNTETDWGAQFGLYALNTSTHLFEYTSYTDELVAIIYDSSDIMFDENDVSIAIHNTKNVVFYLYDDNHYLVGYVYSA